MSVGDSAGSLIAAMYNGLLIGSDGSEGLCQSKCTGW